MDTEPVPQASDTTVPVMGIEQPIPSRIVIVSYPGQHHWRDFCVNELISNVDCLRYPKPFRGLSYNSKDLQPLEVTLKLLDWILAIQGVEICAIQPYRIGVGKTPAVEWSEILDRILEGVHEVVYPQVTFSDVEIWSEEDGGENDDSNSTTPVGSADDDENDT